MLSTTEKRKKRRAHRKMAKYLLDQGTFLNPGPMPGTTLWGVAQWHLEQARKLGR